MISQTQDWKSPEEQSGKIAGRGWYKVANFLAFQAGWFACVVGAAEGSAWFGPAIVAVLVALQLTISRRWRSETWFLAKAACLGTVFDTALKSTGSLTYAADPFDTWLAPPWISAMWVNFALTFHGSMSWLRERYLLASALGALGGPLAYWAGSELGGISVQIHWTAASVILGLLWALALPTLLWIAKGRDS